MIFAKFPLYLQGFLQASGLVGYIFLVATFFMSGQVITATLDEFWAPVILLLLFVISATVSATIVLGRAMYLFWEKRYEESFRLVGWTIAWGVGYFVVILSGLYVFN